MAIAADDTIRFLLFDLDDTLIVEWKSAESSFIQTIVQSGYSIDPADFVKTIRAQARELWYQLPTIDFCLKIGISSWEALWADFSGDDPEFGMLRELAPDYRLQSWYNSLKKYGIDSLASAGKLSNLFKLIRNEKHILYPETADTLHLLKRNYRLGLITNGALDLQWKKIEGGRLKGFFDTITISGELGFAKPDARIFSEALVKLGAKKEETLMVGDTLGTDIKGAQELGIKTAWINREKKPVGDIVPDHQIISLTELVGILNILNNTV
jgi:putative hydrolase of the HAD superfamily